MPDDAVQGNVRITSRRSRRIGLLVPSQPRAGRLQNHGLHCPFLVSQTNLTGDDNRRLILLKALVRPFARYRMPSWRNTGGRFMTKQSLIPVGTERAVLRRESNPFAFLQQEIDRLFDGFSRNFPSLATAASAVPSMDVSENDKVIEISAELPGLEKKDVELNIADNILTIRGEKKNEREEKNKNYHLVERSFGAFTRSVELPAGVMPENIVAEIANGVLKVTVQKPAPKQSKQIEIKTAA
ncbi:MAG: Hsp20/alpha crystallin family protein [Tardiphaga sp.]